MIGKVSACLALFALMLTLGASTPIGCSATFNSITGNVVFNTTAPPSLALGYNSAVTYTTCSETFSTATNTVVNSMVTGNFTVNSPPIAQAASYGKTVTPSNSIQSFATSINNVSISLVVNAIAAPPNVTHTVSAGDANVTINNVRIVAPPKCTLRGSISPSFNSSVSLVNSTGSCSVNESIAKIPDIFINVSVRASLNSSVTTSNSMYGGHVRYSFTAMQPNESNAIIQLGIGQNVTVLGARIFAPSYNDFLTDPLQIPLYNRYVTNSTCSNMDLITTSNLNGTPVKLCVQPKDELKPSIFAACTSYNLKYNLTPTGLYNCFANMTLSFNSTSRYWKLQAIGANGTGGYYGLYVQQLRNATFWGQQTNASNDVYLGLDVLFFFMMLGWVAAFLMELHANNELRKQPPFATTEEPAPSEQQGDSQ